MKILVLAGGSDQVALILELQKRGHDVILVDYLSDPVAKAYVDKHIIASTLDFEKVKEIAIVEKVNLIATACTDQALLTVAKVSEELSLFCYISYDSALKVTNKLYMKDVLCLNGIPTSKYYISDGSDIFSIKLDSYPLVVKPVDCNSSKGVKKVSNKQELNKALSEAIAFSRTKTAIVEEFKEGNELSADFFIENGKAKLLSVTGSTKIKDNAAFTILQSIYPVITSDEEVKVIEIGQKIADAFELKNCPLLVQMIYTNSKDLYVLEFSARMGGGSKYKLIEVLSGVEIMKVYVDLILGNQIHIPARQISVKYAVMNYIYCNPGIFCGIENLEKMLKKNIVDYYFLYKTLGTKIESSKTSGDRPAGFLITGMSANEVESKILYVDQEITVLDEQNNDMMKHGIYPVNLYAK
jgi:Phosphoribosylamine-glycine ligase